MADMRDFYYRQKVSEGELDSAFSGLETADKNAAIDFDFAARDDPDPSAKGNHGGIMWGWGLALSGGMDVTIQPGAGYDEDGQRVATTAVQVLNCSNDGYTAIGAGGLPTGSDTDPGVGNERWLSVFIVFDRSLSDARYDGYNNLVYFARDESFKFRVKAGPTGVLGSNPSKPAREFGEILLDDVRVTNSGGTPSIAAIDLGVTTRRKEYYFDYTGSNSPLAPLTSDPLSIKGKGNPRDVMAATIELLNDHVGGVAHNHSGQHVGWTSAGHLWADNETGTMGTAAAISEGLWYAIDDLASKQPEGAPRAGASCIGIRALAGVASAQDSGTPANLSQTTLQDAIEGLLQAINARVFRGGDTGVGYLYPTANGTDLGDSGGNRWDGWFRALGFNGGIWSNLTPISTNNYDLGTTTQRWKNVWVSNSIVNAGLTDLDGNVDIEGWVDIADTLTVAGTTTFNGFVITYNNSAFNGIMAVKAQDGYDGLILGQQLAPTYWNKEYLVKANVLHEEMAVEKTAYGLAKPGHLALPTIFYDSFMYSRIRPESSVLSEHVSTHWASAPVTAFADFAATELQESNMLFNSSSIFTYMPGGFAISVKPGLSGAGSNRVGGGIIGGLGYGFTVDDGTNMITSFAIHTPMVELFGFGEIGFVDGFGVTRVGLEFSRDSIRGFIRGLDASTNYTPNIITAPFGDYIARITVLSDLKAHFQVGDASGTSWSSETLSVAAGSGLSVLVDAAPYALCYEYTYGGHPTTDGSGWALHRIVASDQRRQDIGNAIM